MLKEKEPGCSKAAAAAAAAAAASAAAVDSVYVTSDAAASHDNHLGLNIELYVVKFAVEGKATALAAEAARYEMLQAVAGEQHRAWPRYYGRFQAMGVDAIVLEYTGKKLWDFASLTVQEK
jgi:hypothetical protein